VIVVFEKKLFSNFQLVASLFAFSDLTLAFQSFTRKHCLRILGLTMRSVAWNRFSIKNSPIDSLLISHVESSYLQTWDSAKIAITEKFINALLWEWITHGTKLSYRWASKTFEIHYVYSALYVTFMFHKCAANFV